MYFALCKISNVLQVCDKLLLTQPTRQTYLLNNAFINVCLPFGFAPVNTPTMVCAAQSVRRVNLHLDYTNHGKMPFIYKDPTVTPIII